MLVKVAYILNNRCKIQADSHLLVGVSGGPDSLCLLYVLHELGYQVIAMHVNHHLRPEADEDAQVVKQAAAKLGVEYFCSEVNVIDYASRNSTSIEEAARELRYRELFSQAKCLRADAVVVGHNADDQVETILMHLLRGSALGGLQGMEFCKLPNPWSEDIPLVRPFLTTWRDEIKEYVIAQGLSPAIDRSNQDVAFYRNRIRHELLPVLEGYNPSIREALLRMGEILKDDYSVIQQLIDKAWVNTVVKVVNGQPIFHSESFVSLPVSLQRHLLRRAISQHIPGLRDVDFDCIDRGIKLLTGGKPRSQTDLVAGLRLVKDGENFWLASWGTDQFVGDYPVVTGDTHRVLSIPSIVRLQNDWQLEVEEFPPFQGISYQFLENLNPYEAWMDIEKVDLPLVLRSRIKGDKIIPLGLNGHTMKISDVMINLKLPRWARTTWPLICAGDEVVWMPGYRISETVRITPQTKKTIRLSLRQLLTT